VGDEASGKAQHGRAASLPLLARAAIHDGGKRSEAALPGSARHAFPGAVCLTEGKGVALVLPSCNTTRR
jgi:hypothetical protein